jgi:hypothetical protein
MLGQHTLIVIDIRYLALASGCGAKARIVRKHAEIHRK